MRCLYCWFCGILLVTTSVFLLAQTPDTATMHGQVVDQTQAAVSGAAVIVTNTLTGAQRRATTNPDGRFVLASLPVAGNYEVTVHKEGFAAATLSKISLVSGTAADITIHLAISGMQTKITLTGTVGEVRADQPQLGENLTAALVQETPLLNRRITYLPLLNSANRPAINQGDVFMNENLFTTNGTGRRQAWFEVDGSNGVDAWGRQTIFSNIPVDAIQEMTVLTNAFSAEYGLTAGSVVNIVTKTGGNNYHGGAEIIWRPSDTEASLSGFTPATASSGNDLTNDTLRQLSADFSGPIGRQHQTHFFLAGEYSWQNRASPVTSPIAPGNFIGHYRGWLGLLRIDHQIDDNNKLFFRSSADSFFDTNPNGAVGGNNLPSVDRIFKRRTYSEELGETAVLSPFIVNNLRLQFQLASPITQFAPTVYGTQFSVPVSTGGTFTSGTSQSALLMNRQYEVNDAMWIQKGRHALTFGGDVIRTHTGGNSKEYGGPIYDGQFVYNTCTQSLSVCESSAYLDDISNVQRYTQSYGNADYVLNDTLWSLFAQDNIRLRQDLTLNLGLRYERQTFTDSTKNFGPRVGFAYSVHELGNTVIRGGFGMYYSQIVDNSEANYALSGPTGVFNYTASPGQIGFPTSVADAPLPTFPAGAVVPLQSLYIRPGESAYYNQFFPTSTLIGYPNVLLSPYTEQWTLGVEHNFSDWVLSMDYVGSHTVKVNRPLDVDPPAPFVRTAPGQVRSAQAANCTRPYWIWWYAQNGMTCDSTTASNPEPPYSVIQSDVNDGYGTYNAFAVDLSHNFTHALSLLASYTWSHAINNVDPDVPGQNPNDPNFVNAAEKGDAIYDQRNRFVLSGFYQAPFKLVFGGVATLGSGLPYNIITGLTNSGDTRATTDRPVINGAVIGRNTGRGGAIYSVDPFVERVFTFGEGIQWKLRAEVFNVFNHANFVGYSGTWGNGATPGPGFGEALAGITNQLPAREFQFSTRLSF